MSNVTKEKMREEAIARLKILEQKGLHPNVLREFEAESKLNYSERVNFGGAAAGILYWMDSAPELMEKVKEFEEEHNALVYHATAERFVEVGRMLDLFYVSAYEEEWEQDRTDLEEEYALCYAAALDNPICSEFGGISFKVAGGGLVRVG